MVSSPNDLTLNLNASNSVPSPNDLNLNASNSNASFIQDHSGQNSSSAFSSINSGVSTAASDSFLDLSGTDTEEMTYYVEQIVGKRMENGQVSIKIK